eukprot:242383-Hanusia_phi.AAC.1
MDEIAANSLEGLELSAICEHVVGREEQQKGFHCECSSSPTWCNLPNPTSINTIINTFISLSLSHHYFNDHKILLSSNTLSLLAASCTVSICLHLLGEMTGRGGKRTGDGDAEEKKKRRRTGEEQTQSQPALFRCC